MALAETNAWRNRDAEAWKSTWLQDASVSRTVVSSANYSHRVGWDAVSAPMLKDFRANPEKINATTKNDAFNIRRDGNMAWLEYVQRLVSSDNSSDIDESLEQRVLVTTGGTWKIASQMTYVTSTLGNSPEAVEARINSAGYALLTAKKPQEAIDLFKINVRLYPQSWNAYDSLAEAYAAAGQNDLAIKNYEKSVELNPKNTAGLQALKKFRQH